MWVYFTEYNCKISNNTYLDNIDFYSLSHEKGSLALWNHERSTFIRWFCSTSLGHGTHPHGPQWLLELQPSNPLHGGSKRMGMDTPKHVWADSGLARVTNFSGGHRGQPWSSGTWPWVRRAGGEWARVWEPQRGGGWEWAVHLRIAWFASAGMLIGELFGVWRNCLTLGGRVTPGSASSQMSNNQKQKIEDTVSTLAPVMEWLSYQQLPNISCVSKFVRNIKQCHCISKTISKCRKGTWRNTF